MNKKAKINFTIGLICSVILVYFGFVIHWSLWLVLIPVWGVPIGCLIHLKIKNRKKLKNKEVK